MKTRNALFALCLPLAFAACQNEELADLGNQGAALKDRGVVDVTITAARPDASADTRMSSEWAGTSLNFLWEKGEDKLGAALMDEVTAGMVNGASVYVNNPFIAQNDGASAEFKSPSSLTKGIYLFYNQYQDVLDRKELKLVMGAQEYDPASTKTTAQQMAKYMKMISPMVDLSDGVGLEAAESFSLPLQFVNLYTPVKVPVVFKNAPEGTKLTQIRIDRASDEVGTAAQHFVLGNKINPTVLSGTINKGAYPYVLKLKDGKIDESKVKVADAIAALDAMVQKGADDAGVYNATAPTYGSAVLNIKGGDELVNGVAKEYWVLIPRGSYGKLYINVETSNGNMTELVKNIPAPAEGEADLRVFDSKYRKIAQVEVDFANNVSQPTEFTINSGDDWTRYTQYVMDHVTSYIGRDIVFELGANKKVYVTSMPQFGFTLKGNTSASLVLGNSDKSAATVSADFSGVKMDNEIAAPSVVIGEGAVVTWSKDAASGTFTLTNNGTLKLNVHTIATTVTNNNTLELNAKDATGIALNNYGTVAVNSEVTLTSLNNSWEDENEVYHPGTINVNADAILTMATGTTNDGIIVVKANGELKNAGTFTNAEEGVINNYGKLGVATGTYTNNGTIKIQDGSFSTGGAGTITNGPNGVIKVMNPVTYVNLQPSKAYDITGAGKVTAVVSTREAYKAAKGANMNVTLGGGEWTLKPNGGTEPANASRELRAEDFAATTPLAGNAIAEIGLQANLSTSDDINLNAVAVVASGDATLTVAKNKTLNVKSLTVEKTKTVTIAANSKVLVADDEKITVKGKIINNGTLGVVDGGATVADLDGVTMATMDVQSEGEVINNNVIGGELNSAVNVTVSGKMTNTGKKIYGAVNLDNPKEWKGGTQYNFAPIVTNATNLSDFAGAVSITASGVVTTIPAKTDITFTGAPAITDLTTTKGNYGTLTFGNNGSISAESGKEPTINKIRINGGATLTVNGNDDIYATEVTKYGTGTATITDANNHLKDNATDQNNWTTANVKAEE